MSDQFKRNLEIPVSMPLPFNQEHMLSINPVGTKTVNETYVPQQDIINCVPGAWVAMCKLIQTQDTDAAVTKLQISEEEMKKAVDAFRYLISAASIGHPDFNQALLSSGFADVSWEARTWVLKNFGQVMVHMWWTAAKMRVNNIKQYNDTPVHQAADDALRAISGRGL